VQLVWPVPTARGFVIAWGAAENAGLPLQTLQQLQVTAPAKESQRKTLPLLDVRSPQEWKKGHAPRAPHIFLGDLPAKLGQLLKADRIAVYCDSGYRASICVARQRQRFSGA
jgi:hydroxyacylglutathione hydrolase